MSENALAKNLIFIRRDLCLKIMLYIFCHIVQQKNILFHSAFIGIVFKT